MKKIINFDTILSTNLYFKENYQSLDNLIAVTAKHQTLGRGRLGRIWEDGDDLLMSILIKEMLDINKIEKISLLIASSIYKVIKKYFHDVTIKWPNDILLNGKKVCGILVESIISDKLECLIIGFGINVNTLKMNDELKDKATSFSIESNKQYSIENIAKEVYETFIDDFSNYKNGSKEYLEICKTNSCLIGKEVSYFSDKEHFAKVIDILENGHILLLEDDGFIEKSSGEVSLHSTFYHKK